MSYQTAIPDGFEPPQYRDEKFNEALTAYRDRGLNKPGAQWVVALPRPDFDPTSRTRFEFGDHVSYKLGTKEDQVAVMQVLGVGDGRVRLGLREVMPVAVGDIILLNLREAGHWQYIEGILTYWFTGDVAMARIYRTDKPTEPPVRDPGESAESYSARRDHWHDALFWNLRDVLNDYVLLGRDPAAEHILRNGPEKLIQAPDTVMADGARSDDARDNRFPIVYRRVLGAGPGRVMRSVSDLGLVEREETKSEAQPGDMLSYVKNFKAATFVFQGMPLEVIHAASTLNIKLGSAWHRLDAQSVDVHQSCEKPLAWDAPSEVDDQEQAHLRGERTD